ncbi:DUF3667 domain-containing protein [Caulobacter sp. 73W]|uniref:DUF3667 domain-containing protein n=1 Tax=Caulobacter sp. 73W TaxID=3161137 RepID=A0AB39KPI2_9CAUL
MDIDAAGVGATHGLIGRAVERPEGSAGEHHGICADCGAQTTGKFCSNCGQPTHVHRSLLHLGEEILHGVMHFDSRIWRTLPLLFINPGRLTREWVEGKRSRYVSPLGMYLFTVFVVFMLLSFAPAARNEGQSAAPPPPPPPSRRSAAPHSSAPPTKSLRRRSPRRTCPPAPPPGSVKPPTPASRRRARRSMKPTKRCPTTLRRLTSA